MATDATITQTNRDFFTGSSLMIPAAFLAGGIYFYVKGHPPGMKAPKDQDVLNALAVTAGGLAAFVLYKQWRREHPPAVGMLPPYQGPISPR